MRELEELYKQLPLNASLLDVGCFGFNLMRATQGLRADFKHFGVDYCDYDHIPTGFIYKKADLNKETLPYDDDSMNLVVASHVLEHLEHPVDFVSDCIRVCKPGGYLFIATPSERALFLPGMPFAFDKFYSTSFFDDPTHIGRPWTPQSLHRLTRYFHCEPLVARHATSWKARLAFPILFPYALLTRNPNLLEKLLWGTVGWSSHAIIQKPLTMRGAPPFSYYIPSRST